MAIARKYLCTTWRNIHLPSVETAPNLARSKNTYPRKSEVEINNVQTYLVLLWSHCVAHELHSRIKEIQREAYFINIPSVFVAQPSYIEVIVPEKHVLWRYRHEYNDSISTKFIIYGDGSGEEECWCT